jgi:hypothetical protein
LPFNSGSSSVGEDSRHVGRGIVSRVLQSKTGIPSTAYYMSSALSTRLIALLLEKRNSGGLAFAREGALTTELACSPDQLRACLGTLVAEGWIEVFAPLPFLAVKMKMWPGNAPNSAVSGPMPYSYSSLSQPRLIKDSYRGPVDPLLQEILETTGETDPTSFRGALEAYSPSVIRMALVRVRSARTIRKNKTALFRHLLPRLARESSR